MKTKKQNADFLHVGRKLLDWYATHGRDLPFRQNTDPYRIWISEIIFQQTRIAQGLDYYQKFITRFPTVQSLAAAETDEVMLQWKGLGYYSRALNLHKAAKQIVEKHSGKFPSQYEDILNLQGVGRYTAAAVSSICFGEQRPAVDGNFYRVLSRVFADNFDVAASSAFNYFADLALRMMPPNEAGAFNQAVMDLGSEVCKPRNPVCEKCPIQLDCLAFQFGKYHEFPVKGKKAKVTDLSLHYSFVECNGKFLVKQRDTSFIWKKLYEFPVSVPKKWNIYIRNQKTVSHKLTHKNITITLDHLVIPELSEFLSFAGQNGYTVLRFENSSLKSFPKPLENYLESFVSTSAVKGDAK